MKLPKQPLKYFLTFLIISNTVLFVIMAYFHLLSTDPVVG